MEDAHIINLNILNNDNDKVSAIFGVFDGHGGSTVSTFCS